MLNFAPISPRFVNSVTLRGNVASPGRYPWHEGMRIADLIPNREFLITREYWSQQNAINLQAQESGARPGAALNDVKRNAPEINWDYAVVQRMSSKDLSTELVPFNLGKAVLEHQDSSNLVLQPGDIVTIFSQADLRVPREQQTKLVRLEGEFASAGIYRAQSAQGLRELVAQAGGLASSAYLYAAVFTRESTRIQQQERLDMVIAQMERDLARQAVQSSQNARTSDEANAARATLEAQRASLDKLRQLKADGRIVLNLHPDDTSVDAIPDIPLEDGDQFYVPSRPIVVGVVGDVYNQGSFIQRPGKTVSRYLRDAGGPTRAADKGRIFVVRANGAVVSKDAASGILVGRFRKHGHDAGRYGGGSRAIESRRSPQELQGLVADPLQFRVGSGGGQGADSVVRDAGGTRSRRKRGNASWEVSLCVRVPGHPSSPGSNAGLDDAAMVAAIDGENGIGGGIDLIELLLILSRKKAAILKFTLAAAVVAAIVSLLLPKMYTATSTILPPQQSQSALTAMLGQLSTVAGLNESDLGLKNPADLFIAMLNSRTIDDRLIDRFDLRKVYWVKRYQDARKKLESRSYIIAEREGLISVSVADRDPQRAADLANGYVEELHAMNSYLAVSEAAQRRVFYQQKLDAEREELALSELALKKAQEKSGLLQPDAQARAIIQSVADMRAQVALHEVQVQAMRTYATAGKSRPAARGRGIGRPACGVGQAGTQHRRDWQRQYSSCRPGNCRKPNWNISAGPATSSITKPSMTFSASNWKPPGSTKPRMRWWCRWWTRLSCRRGNRVRIAC